MAEKVKELWIYTGSALEKGGTKVLRCFKVVEDGYITEKEHAYHMRTSYVIGGLYEIDVEREDGKTLIRANEFKFIGMYGEEDVVEKLKAQEKIFQNTQKTIKFEKKYKTGFQMPQQLNAIASIYKDLDTYTQIKEFEAMIIEEVRKRAKMMGELKA